MKKIYLFFMLSTLVLSSALAGTEISGGGGNGYVIEFRRLAKQSMETLLPLNPLIVSKDKIDLRKLQRSLQDAQIESTSKPLILDGTPVSAINFPKEKKIIFNRKDWTALGAEARLQLVLHELMGLTYGRTLDATYSVSSKLLEYMHDQEIERAVLAVAKASVWGNEKMRVLRQRTKVIQDYDSMNDEVHKISQIAVQTFENSSPESMRIYQVEQASDGTIFKIELVHTEGPVGP